MSDEWRTWTNDGEPPPHVVDREGKTHSLAVACYRKLSSKPTLAPPTDEILPTFECTCGMWWSADSWQDAGESFDDHLEDVTDGPA